MIHVRQQPPRARGTQWYRDKSVWESATLCGAPCDRYDVPLRDTKRKNFDMNHPFWASKGGFCPECLNRATKEN